MTKQLLFALLAAAGCGTTTPGADDVTDPPDAGMQDPPIDPGVLSIVPAHWKDERNDAIDFSSGEPVHIHQGASVTVGAGNDCPEVYRYGYLMDRAPMYGRQTTTNPIGFEIAVPTLALDPSASQYRLTTKNNEALIPWTSFGAVDEDHRAQIAIHRDTTPKLAAYDGELRLDVRVRDTAGVEQLASACWTHHTLAAPLVIEPVQAALGPAALSGRSLAVPASRPVELFRAASSVYTFKVTQQTAEPVDITIIKPTPIVGSFSATLAHTWIPVTPTGPIDLNCETGDYCQIDPLPTLAPISAAGALTSGTSWTQVIDEATDESVVCSGSCTLPGRAAGAAPKSYRVTVSIGGMWDLWPDAATRNLVENIDAAGNVVVGALPNTPRQLRCNRIKTNNNVSICLAPVTYAEALSLDGATLALPPATIGIQAAGAHTPATALPYLPNSALTTMPIAWDGGDGPL